MTTIRSRPYRLVSNRTEQENKRLRVNLCYIRLLTILSSTIWQKRSRGFFSATWTKENGLKHIAQKSNTTITNRPSSIVCFLDLPGGISDCGQIYRHGNRRAGNQRSNIALISPEHLDTLATQTERRSPRRTCYWRWGSHSGKKEWVDIVPPPRCSSVAVGGAWRPINAARMDSFRR